MCAADTYRAAGVDTAALEEIKEKIGAFSRITHGPEVLSGVGGFASMYRLEGYRDPVLVSSADGVGTKSLVGSRLGHYESLGIDLVNLNVNDVLTRGARPLFFLDYISMGRLDPQLTDSLLRGMAWACRETGCALVGGETAQMPGLYAGDGFDLAGFVVGAVERDSLLDGSSIVEGDVLLGVPSSGLHTNGFALVRRVFDIDGDPGVLFRRYDELDHSLGEELLVTHRCYYPSLEAALPLLKAMAHVTGGGLVENVPRVLPEGLAALLRPASWEVQPIFEIIAREGRIEREEMFRVFNMGLGMVLVCSPEQEQAVRLAVPDASVVGEVVPKSGDQGVLLEGV